jgi:hypothetical protein
MYKQPSMASLLPDFPSTTKDQFREEQPLKRSNSGSISDGQAAADNESTQTTCINVTHSGSGSYHAEIIKCPPTDSPVTGDSNLSAGYPLGHNWTSDKRESPTAWRTSGKSSSAGGFGVTGKNTASKFVPLNLPSFASSTTGKSLQYLGNTNNLTGKTANTEETEEKTSMEEGGKRKSQRKRKQQKSQRKRKQQKSQRKRKQQKSKRK